MGKREGGHLPHLSFTFFWREYRLATRVLGMSVSLLLLSLALAGGGGALEVPRQRAPGDAGFDILFPRPGQTLCNADQLELVALYDGSPLVPPGLVAVSACPLPPSHSGRRPRRWACSVTYFDLQNSC